MISKGFDFVAFFASVEVSSVCIIHPEDTLPISESPKEAQD
jgi:hypothetical protein